MPNYSETVTNSTKKSSENYALPFSVCLCLRSICYIRDINCSSISYYRIAILMHKIINEAINISDLDISVDRTPVVLRTTSDTSLSVCGVKTNYGKQKIQ